MAAAVAALRSGGGGVAARLGRLVVEIVVRPWSEHSTAARSTIIGLVLAGTLGKAVLGWLLGGRRAAPAASAGSAATSAATAAAKPAPIRRVLGLVMPTRQEGDRSQSGLVEMVLVVFFNFARIAMELVSANVRALPLLLRSQPAGASQPASDTESYPASSAAVFPRLFSRISRDLMLAVSRIVSAWGCADDAGELRPVVFTRPVRDFNRNGFCFFFAEANELLPIK
jgi:hypothetical protein